MSRKMVQITLSGLLSVIGILGLVAVNLLWTPTSANAQSEATKVVKPVSPSNIAIGVFPIVVPPPLPPKGMCTDLLPWRLQPGQGALISTGSANLVIRGSAALDGIQLGVMHPGALVKVLGVPVCKDGISWYPVEYVTTTGAVMKGWAAEGQGSHYFMEPLQPAAVPFISHAPSFDSASITFNR